MTTLLPLFVVPSSEPAMGERELVTVTAGQFAFHSELVRRPPQSSK